MRYLCKYLLRTVFSGYFGAVCHIEPSLVLFAYHVMNYFVI